MLRKFAIFGFLLLLLGSVMIGRFLSEKKKDQKKVDFYKLKYASESDEYLKQYHQWLQLPAEDRGEFSLRLNKDGKEKPEAQIIQEQQQRLKADMDKLAADEMNLYPFADVLYGENWQEELKKYKRQKELSEFILTGSIVCASAGGIIIAWCLLLWIARLIIRCVSRLSERIASTFRHLKKNKNNQLFDIFENENQGKSEQLQDIQKSHFETCLKSPNESSVQNFETYIKNRKQRDVSEKSLTLIREPCDDFYENAEKIASLLTDEKSSESQNSATSSSEATVGPSALLDLSNTASKTILLDSKNDPLELGESLKIQTENLEKQIAEFKNMAESVQKTTIEHSKPLNNILKDLTQQVSAIRQYASYQQDRIEKLQDGYDWNIIRTFCIRVIRCIDNLESRIIQLAEQSTDTSYLEEIRDELLFALDSSGVERFEPEIKSDYRGQEKLAEAIKEKQSCDDHTQMGRIAEVIRPGYQYFIDEENVKVVRTAQVKLFG